MLKRITSHSAAAEAARIGLIARKAMIAAAAAAVLAGAVSVIQGERQPMAPEQPVAMETGHAIQYRPSASQLNEAMGAFDRFRDQPAIAGTSSQQLALSSAGTR